MEEPLIFDWNEVWEFLQEQAVDYGNCKSICDLQVLPENHGTLAKWLEAWHRLPSRQETGGLIGHHPVSVLGTLNQTARDDVRETLMAFHPWRKGPYKFMGIEIDTEWRSDLKWDRLAPQVSFDGKRVLDVGCGNGYYGWRMLDAGAKLVLGCDPFLLYMMQFEVFRRYAPDAPHYVLPIGDEELPERMQLFDLCLSMGVLYHRTSPIDHLKKLHSTLQVDGELVLETLVIEGDEESVLVPEGRYAKMRNVWFIPTVRMLSRWLRRTGFREVRILDVSPTTEREQRRTAWMTFESLSDFLALGDPGKTCEGYPGPVRAMIHARKK